VYRTVVILLAVTAIVVVGASATAAPAAGVLRLWMPGDAYSLDPAVASDFTTAIASKVMHLTLVRTDSRGRILPMGARSWTTSGGGLVYTFELDPRARFHNGRPVTAADWKWSFDRLANPETKAGAAAAVLGGVVGFDAVRRGDTTSLAGIRVVGPLRLQIALRPEGRGGFLNRLTHYAAAVLNREEVESGGPTWFERTSAGAGPFRLVRWERNAKFVFEGHAGFVYGSPRTRDFEMLIVPSAATRLNLYEAGELHATDVPLTDYRRVAQDPRYRDELRVFPRAQVLWLGLNPEAYPPFRDRRVRQAVAMAIDRDRIARTVFFGFYTPAGAFVPPQVSGALAAVEPAYRAYPYDPQRAKQLLAEAGVAGRLPPLELPNNPAAPDYQMAAEAVAAMLKEHLGMDVRVLRQEHAAWSTGLVRREFPALLAGWTAAYLDYGYYLDLLLDSRSGLNFTNYKNPEFDRLIDQANAARSDEEREAVYRRAERLALADAHVIPLVFTRFAHLVKPQLKGYEGSPLNLGISEFWGLALSR